MPASHSHLLIVDDDPGIAAVVERFALKLGFTVSRATAAGRRWPSSPR